ncbi:MAG TPA: MBL fold metallo-hydrolase [Syntrophomonadaceae bacterium]|nr:MBL fold metallo-hydrolase [Syntrophomonadaceae bacterium]
MLINITDRIKLIRPLRKSKFPYSNSILVEDDMRTLIDAGAGGNAYADIAPTEVDLLLLSHNHFDHIHGAGLFNQANMMVAEEEAEAYKSQAAYDKLGGFDLWDKLMDQPRDNTLALVASSYDDVKRPEFSDFRVKDCLADGMVINTGHTEITALHTPGHSPGHYAFFFEKERILFSCDLDLAPRGPWYGGSYCDIGQLEKSVYRLMAIEPSLLVTSHRRIFDWQKDNVPSLFQQYIGIALQREERVITYLKEPRTLDELANQEFENLGYPGSTMEVFWTKVMFLNHLNKLQRNGQVTKTEDGRWVLLI